MKKDEFMNKLVSVSTLGAKSIRAKLLLLVLPIVAVGLIVLSGVIYRYMDEVLERQILESAIVSTQDATDAVGDWMNERKMETQQSAPAYINAGNDAAAVQKATEPRWKLMKEQFARSYDNVGYVPLDGTGTLLKIGKNGPGTENIKGAAAYADVLKGDADQVITKPEFDKAGNVVFVVGSALKAADGHRQGMITAEVTLNEVEDKVKALRFGDNGYSILIDGDGTYLYSPDKDKILNKKIEDSDDPGVKELGRKMLSGRADMFRYQQVTGEKMVAIYYPVPGTGWSMATIAYADELFAPAMNALMIMAGISLILLLLISVGITVAINVITKPLKGMMAEMHRLADGDFREYDTGIKSDDELGHLADAMKSMREELGKVIKTVRTSSESLAASVEELNATTGQSAKASSQIADSIMAVAAGAADQLDAVNSTTDAMQQFNTDIEAITNRTRQAASKGHEAASVAQAGGDKLNQAINQIKRIAESTEESTRMVAELGKRSNEIGNIVDTISEIAEQTNLLALNAAIEAARAGDAGRGFAVVADEVRKLAESSQQAAKQIAELIAMIQQDTQTVVDGIQAGGEEVKSGTESILSTGEAFKSIVTIVDEVSDQLDGISQAVQRVAKSGQTIDNNVRRMEQASRQTAQQAETVSATTEEQTAAVHEISDSSHTLAQMADELQENVERFKL
ncbi:MULTISPECIES: methyl-accepting chemotaxis protein [Selenomonas]|uniref:HAMP domain-containing protein n=1 Tax=Selenomonas ruminis TaxID=2593411 RepID=A0A5D6WB45_9FIRM|nr:MULTISPECIES: methyl-accepting chemotaxis protein [unclassified Selenomonas]MBQ1868783.1 HAMP domain-containing protein [Selenomonas sp.]TYZ23948.1 HAMP domain-containing protein [Selenomonas sp. mPRGC5]